MVSAQGQWGWEEGLVGTGWNRRWRASLHHAPRTSQSPRSLEAPSPMGRYLDSVLLPRKVGVGPAGAPQTSCPVTARHFSPEPL